MKVSKIYEGTIGDCFNDEYIAEIIDKRKNSFSDIFVNFNGIYFRVEKNDSIDSLKYKYKEGCKLASKQDAPSLSPERVKLASSIIGGLLASPIELPGMVNDNMSRDDILNGLADITVELTDILITKLSK